VNQSDLMKLGVALAVTWAVYKFVPSAAAKAAALGVAGTIVAKQIPFVKEALA
jgi:hypothetical protein